MRIEDVRLFVGGMNSDDDDRLLPPGDYRDALHFRNGSTTEGNLGAGENIKGNTAVAESNPDFALPVGENRLLGVTKDELHIVYFVYNSLGNHSIVRMNYQTLVLEYVLESEPILNFVFSKDTLVLNPIIVDTILYWTDNYNPPRKLNIERAIQYTANKSSRVPFTEVVDCSFYGTWDVGTLGFLTDSPLANNLAPGHKIVIAIGATDHPHNRGEATVVGNSPFGLGSVRLITTDKTTDQVVPYDSTPGYAYAYNGNEQYYGLDEQVLSQIKYPPCIAPTASYDTDTSRSTNLLGNDIYRFRYRWVYDDNEKSVWSPISVIAYPTGRELANGFSNPNLILDNRLNVWYDTGTTEVTKVEIAIQKGMNGAWSLIRRERKRDTDGNIIIPSNVYHQYLFYNDTVGEGLVQSDVERMQDDVPLLAGSIELLNKNRLVYGDYVEGYDNVDLDVSLTTKYNDVQLPGKFIGKRTDIHPNPSYAYMDSRYPGSMIKTLLLDQYATTYHPELLWMFRHKVIYTNYSTIQQVRYYNAYYMAKPGDTIDDVMAGIIANIRLVLQGKVALLDNQTNPNPAIQYPYIDYFQLAQGEGDLVNILQDVEVYLFGETDFYGSYKYQQNHYFGIEYSDDGNRSGATNVSDDTRVFVDPIYQNNPHVFYDPTASNSNNSFKQVVFDYSINHKPPSWAKYWRWVYAKDNTPFTYSMATDFYEDSGKVYFNVNQFFGDFTESNGSSVLSDYVWKKGDRVRFIGLKKHDTSFTYPYPTLGTGDRIYMLDANEDYEILGEHYDTTDNNIYEQYEADKYVSDANGNRVYNPSYQRLYVVGLDLSKYGIELIRPTGSTIGVTDTDRVLVEIYTPNTNPSVESLVYYEHGPTHKVGTDQHGNKYHEAEVNQEFDSSGNLVTPASGTLDYGNVFLRLRFHINKGYGFPVEAINLSDFRDSDVHDFGRPSTVIPDMIQKRYDGNLLYGGVFIQDTLVNDLTKVDSVNAISLSNKYGRITGMRQVGDTLKVLQEYKGTSIYIGKIGLKQAGGKGEVVATTDNIFGEIRVSEDDYGCRNPESIMKTLRHLYFYDQTNAKYIRDSANGMQPVSDYKYKTKFRKLAADIEVDFDNVLVYSGYNPLFDEVYVSIVGITRQYTSPHDTLVYAENKDRWTHRVNLRTNTNGTEGFASIGGIFVSFLDGMPWVHGTNELHNNFYGTQWGQELDFVSNKEPIMIKTFQSIGVTSNKTWGCPDNYDIYIPPSDTYPKGMCSRLSPGKFVKREGMLWAALLRNMLTSGNIPSTTDLVGGDYLRGNAIRIKLSNEHTDRVVLFSVRVGATLSK